MVRRIPTIGRTYRHIARYGEIIGILVKYGFDDLLATFQLDRRLNLRGQKGTDPGVRQLSRGNRLRMAFSELGPTFIKLGQFMSSRPDVLPPEIIVALRDLQDSVTPFDPQEAVHVLERELQKPVVELFAEFSEVPVAAASMAQVHRAKLGDGTPVAVKIQRPMLEQMIETDIDILCAMASTIERHVGEARYFDPVSICGEFAHSIRKELDFRNEALHMERFAENFKSDSTIRVPRVFRPMTTRRVITTEFIDGIKATDVSKIREAGLDPHLIAERGTNLVLRQIFEHGFFHADPHPGNLLILPGNVVCFLDFGIMGLLSPTLKEYIVSILLGVVNNDPRRIVRIIAEESHHSIIDPQGLEYEVTELLEDYGLVSLRNINLGELLSRLMRLIVNHHIKVLPGFFLLIKAIVIIEGVGYSLDPEFTLISHIELFAKKMLAQRVNFFSGLYKMFSSSSELSRILGGMPYDVKEIISLIKAGKMHVEFEHRGLEPVLSTAAVLVNRLVFSIVLAALIVGSALVVHSGIPPRIFEIPLFGIIGFIAAGIVAFWLIITALWRKKI
ncbi:MAG TPA: AarF/UbiB family protein [Chitinivibrionales bacterium]|nr:AarF/UbiB family protein [Chitinivibrionales bacterium]